MNKLTTKIQLKTNNDLWNKVKIYKINNNIKTMNEAVIKLITRGLKK